MNSKDSNFSFGLSRKFGFSLEKMKYISMSVNAQAIKPEEGCPSDTANQIW